MSVASEELRKKEIYFHSLVTAAEAAAGMTLGVVLGVLLALFLWGRPALRPSLSAYLGFLGAIPVFALAPLVVLWFGVGFGAKVFMSFASCFVIAAVEADHGVANVQGEYLRLARALGATRQQLVRKVVLPGSIAGLALAARTTAGLALVGAFVGEFVSAKAGLGFFILRASSVYQTSRALFGLLVLSGLGYLLASVADQVVASLVRRVGRV